MATCQCHDKAKCDQMTARIKQCMFAEWYPKLAPLRLTYKSRIIELSEKFVDTYLKADGMHQPEVQPQVGPTGEASDDGNDESQRAEFLEEVARVRQEINDCLTNEFTIGCLVKMNWSSTIDAMFIS